MPILPMFWQPRPRRCRTSVKCANPLRPRRRRHLLARPTDRAQPLRNACPRNYSLFCFLAFGGYYADEALLGRLRLAPQPDIEPGALISRAFAHVGVAVEAQHVE